MKISKKLYAEIYEYFWDRADIGKCFKLKQLFYNQPKTGTYVDRRKLFKAVCV